MSRPARALARLAAPAGTDAGFTMLELMVVLLLIGIVSAIAVFGLSSYAQAQNLSGTAQSVLGSLRSAAERAQSEGRTYCVSFDTATTWSVWRYSCDPADPDYAAGQVVKVDTQHTSGSAVISSASFAAWTGNPQDTNPCPAPALGCVDFSLRTTATPGSVTITQPGSSTVFTVTVVGLTGRAYLTP